MTDAAAAAAALRRAVETMDRLRSPGGCPWDAEQTHRSLAPYVLEETYEVLEAIDASDSDALRDELGDLLLQVLFHARLAEEGEGWDVAAVADGLVAKLVRRHPHVFADVEVSGPAEVNANWESIKQQESERGVTDGIPAALPALAYTAKLQSRAERAGMTAALPADIDPIGAELFHAVARARAAGLDPEQVLRETAGRYRSAVRAEEDAQRADAS